MGLSIGNEEEQRVKQRDGQPEQIMGEAEPKLSQVT
jgi:hypothetical protein